MASSPKSYIICSAFLAVCFNALVQGKPMVVSPWPDNIFPIEGENTQVTCVAFDKDDPNTKPTEIAFVRKDDFGYETKIAGEGPDGHVYFTNRTEMDGRKLFTTMHIKNVNPEDDTKKGRYECQAKGPGGKDDRYGFTISVILRSEIPVIAVSEDQNVLFDESVTLGCNLTHKGSNPQLSPLTNLAWIKDGEILNEVRYPEEEKLRNHEVTVKKPSNAGVYICKLTCKLRKARPYDVIGNITISVKPRFNTDNMKGNQLQYYQGDAGKMTCAAEGNPIEVVWKRKTKADATVVELNQTGTKRYKFSSSTPYKGFFMKVKSLEYTDRGFYYCCIKDENYTVASTAVEDCQEFLLRVKDPLGPLWPVLGIIAEVIVLAIIIIVVERRKKSREKAAKANERVEFSFSSTDDGDKGAVRLRQTGTTPAEKA